MYTPPEVKGALDVANGFIRSKLYKLLEPVF